MITITRIRIYITNGERLQNVERLTKSVIFYTPQEVEAYRMELVAKHTQDGHTAEVLFDKIVRP